MCAHLFFVGFWGVVGGLWDFLRLCVCVGFVWGFFEGQVVCSLDFFAKPFSSPPLAFLKFLKCLVFS